MTKLVKTPEVAEKVLQVLSNHGFKGSSFEFFETHEKLTVGINREWEYVDLRYHGYLGFNISTTCLSMYEQDKIVKYTKEMNEALLMMQLFDVIIPDYEYGE
uniref:Phage protein n=1 Tax=Bacillus phage KoopaTroopa TaxID=3234046 RepID=A0AB39C7L5_9CAUD